VISQTPELTPVTSPVLELTVATPVLELVHVIVGGGRITMPNGGFKGAFPSKQIPLYCKVLPTLATELTDVWALPPPQIDRDPTNGAGATIIKLINLIL
jgi:hypothetical protein